jgi:ribonuclease inhibitor
MREIILNGEKIISIKAFHEEVARADFFPKFYGKNLDSLWECMTADVEGPAEVILKNSEISRKHLGTEYDTIKSLFDEAAQDRPDLIYLRLILKHVLH